MKKVRGKSSTDKSVRQEWIIYSVAWGLVLLFPLINAAMASVSINHFPWASVFRWWTGAVPFFILFIIHRLLLLPHLFLKRRVKTYIAAVVCSVSVFAACEYQIITFYKSKSVSPEILNLRYSERTPDQKAKFIRYRIVPLTMNTGVSILMLGFSLSLVMMFRNYQAKVRLKELEHARIQDELKYLRAQVNPHFFMNMLNNIHAMIELHPDTAQDMTIELSRLMRYVLYEGDNLTTTLADETRFISSYVNMLRRRYPENRVEIVLDMTSDIESKDFIVPPLLFVTFVENAFKHGISYKKKSSVRITFSLDDGKLLFRCFNTLHSHVEGQEGGIGLENAKRRLDLMYGDKYQLDIVEAGDNFTVELIIPGL
jgi:sensor histidine kinase YesM